MTLDEIINVAHLPAEIDPREVEATNARLVVDAVHVKMISSKTELAQLDNFYCARREGKVLAWLSLGDSAEIGGETYDTIKFIYVAPEARKGFIAGSFILALKGELDRPLILGSDSYGGVLFAGGQELVKALHKSAHFDVSVLDLKSGQRTAFTDADLKGAQGKTLVFEQGRFPMYHDTGLGVKLYLFED